MKMNKLINKSSIFKIIKFYSVGLIALLWNTLIIRTFSDFLEMKFIFSILIVFLFNITVIFFLQRKFTFDKNDNKSLLKHFLNFSILIFLLLLIMYIIVPIVNNYLGNFALSSFIIMVLITMINFLVQNFIIFK